MDMFGITDHYLVTLGFIFSPATFDLAVKYDFLAINKKRICQSKAISVMF